MINLNHNHEFIRQNYSVSHLRKLKKIASLETSIIEINDFSIYIKEFKTTVSEKNLNYTYSHLSTLQNLMNELRNIAKLFQKDY